MASKIAVGVCLILLVISNAFWLHAAIDDGVTQKYEGQVIYELSNSKKQAEGMLGKALAGKNKVEVTTLASQFTDLEPFEKDGCLWVGWYGFKFNPDGELVGIETDETFNTNPLCPSDL